MNMNDQDKFPYDDDPFMPSEKYMPAEEEESTEQQPEEERAETPEADSPVKPVPQEPVAEAPEADTESERTKQLQEELAAAKDQTLRALAELENTRKRAQRDREDASAYGISKFARDLLNVSDNLRRALEAVPEDILQMDERIPGIITGIEATERELLKCFEQNGIQKIEPMDERFDPNFHEVMFEAPMPDKPNGTVIQVVEAGYVLKGRLLRAAKVGIAKNVNEPPKGDDGHLVDQEA